MNDQSQLLLRSIKGPVIMITIGVLFAADRFTQYQFHKTWPILLIVIGLMQLLVGRRRRGDYYPPPSPGPSGFTGAVSPYSSSTSSGPNAAAPVVTPEHPPQGEQQEPRQ